MDTCAGARGGLWDDRLRVWIGGGDHWLSSRIGDAECIGGSFRVVDRVGHDDRNWLAVEPDLIVLEDMEPLPNGRINRSLVGLIGQARSVEVADDLDDSGHSQNCVPVDPRNSAETSGRTDDHRIELSVLVEVGRISGSACDFRLPVHTGQRSSDHVRGHATSPAISRARTMVRGSSSTL